LTFVFANIITKATKQLAKTTDSH